MTARTRASPPPSRIMRFMGTSVGKDLTPPAPLSEAERGEQDKNRPTTRSVVSAMRFPAPSPLRRGGWGVRLLQLDRRRGPDGLSDSRDLQRGGAMRWMP